MPVLRGDYAIREKLAKAAVCLLNSRMDPCDIKATGSARHSTDKVPYMTTTSNLGAFEAMDCDDDDKSGKCEAVDCDDDDDESDDKPQAPLHSQTTLNGGIVGMFLKVFSASTRGDRLNLKKIACLTTVLKTLTYVIR